jgi:hypothetical protein
LLFLRYTGLSLSVGEYGSSGLEALLNGLSGDSVWGSTAALLLLELSSCRTLRAAGGGCADGVDDADSTGEGKGDIGGDECATLCIGYGGEYPVVASIGGDDAGGAGARPVILVTKLSIFSKYSAPPFTHVSAATSSQRDHNCEYTCMVYTVMYNCDDIVMI